MHFVMIMDAPDTVIVDEDTSFALMLEAQNRGHRVDHCLIHQLFLRDGKLWARVRQATMRAVAGAAVLLGACMLRPDPTVSARTMTQPPPDRSAGEAEPND